MIGKFLCIAVCLAAAVPAQTPPPNAPSPTAQQQASGEKTSSAPPVKTYTLPPDKLQKAIDYANARNRLHFIGVGYSILVLAGFLAWRIAPALRDWAEGSRRRIA